MPTSTYMHRFIFSVIHLHTYCRYTHGYTETFPFPSLCVCECVLRVKNTFIFSEWSAEAKAVRSHFVFPDAGRKQWPLWPCGEFRVHFLFLMHPYRIKSKNKTRDAVFREGEHSVKPTSKLQSGLTFNSRRTVIGRKFHLCPLSFIH